ncbi:ESX secretion-associated protein EspG [Nocardia sp. NPDC050435]|uniref:ESX secretion-associated protein EspG n=1 Tax=Nocardia sp. NPDC050435 TaxID=3155040 RepID=UPI00340560A9
MPQPPLPQWTLTAEQFAAAWFGTGLDRLPFPFRFTSRFPGLHEYQDYQRRFRRELDADEHLHLKRALRVLGQPDWRIELSGLDHRRRGAVTEMRAIGCASRSGTGVIAMQNPGPDGGKVRLRRCRSDHLATELVRLLPDPPAGTAAERSYLLGDLEDDPTDPFGQDSEARADYRRFWRQSCTTRGTLAVLLGPRNAEPLRTGKLRWIDTAEGRYAETPANRALMIRPATSATITRYLDEAIIRGRARAGA